MPIEILFRKGGRHVLDLAAWARYFSSEMSGPAALLGLPEAKYRRLWSSSFPVGTAYRTPHQVVADLKETMEWYDETTLKAELSNWPASDVSIGEVAVGGLTRVPGLEVTIPISDADLERCLKAFMTFALWPQRKDSAWARFKNSMAAHHPDDVVSIIAFCRRDEQSLLFTVLRESGIWDPYCEIPGVSPQQLAQLTSLGQLAQRQEKT